MNNSDFEGPPWGWSMAAIVGGLVTAIGLIVGLELSAVRLKAHVYSPSTPSSAAMTPTASPLPSK